MRPHESLADATPATRYTPSPRPYPCHLPPLEYPGHYEVRRMSRNGGIRWYKQWVNLSQMVGRKSSTSPRSTTGSGISTLDPAPRPPARTNDAGGRRLGPDPPPTLLTPVTHVLRLNCYHVLNCSRQGHLTRRRAKESPDAGGQPHGQRTPEDHPDRGHMNSGTADVCCEAAQHRQTCQ